MVDLARLAELKSQLADGKLTREEFEVLEQEALQASGTDWGSDRGSGCASTRSASPAPAIGVPVYGAGTGNETPRTWEEWRPRIRSPRQQLTITTRTSLLPRGFHVHG